MHFFIKITSFILINVLHNCTWNESVSDGYVFYVFNRIRFTTNLFFCRSQPRQPIHSFRLPTSPACQVFARHDHCRQNLPRHRGHSVTSPLRLPGIPLTPGESAAQDSYVTGQSQCVEAVLRLRWNKHLFLSLVWFE